MSSVQPNNRPLTPVKVRGKKRNREDATQASKGLGSTTDTVFIPSKSVITKANNQLQSANRSKLKHTRITLQLLPTEILEQIFFDCLEINLLHVFPRLARAVSNERVYSCIAILAIWKEPIPKKEVDDETMDDKEAVGTDEPMNDEPMDEQTRARFELGEKEIMRTFRPVGYRKLSRKEAARLQSQILNCRWATFERISSCVVKCANLTQLRVRGYEEERNEYDLAQVLQLLEDNLMWSYLESLNLKKFGGTWVSMKHTILNRATSYKIFRSPVCIFSIPERAIDKRPWTTQKLRLFRLLRLMLYQGKHPVPIQPFSREVLHTGVHEAIVECRREIVIGLLELDEYCVRSAAYSFKGMSTNSAYEIPPEHFITAARLSTKPNMLQILVRASAESLPFDNPEITQWALIGEKSSCPFYKWLLDFMVQLPSYQRCRSSEKSLFACGMLNAANAYVKGERKPWFYSMDHPMYEEYKRAWGYEPYAWPVELFCPEHLPRNSINLLLSRR
ncbi:hypothetical protein MferCBS31731_001567 [Microsporum ferrugineum]